MNHPQPEELGLLTALGLKLSTVIAGAVGSFVSLNFFDGLSTREKWATFLGGWALAAWLSAPVTEFFEIKPALEHGMSLAIGLFGMSIAAAVIKLIRDTNWGALLAGVVRRKSGGVNEPPGPNEGGGGKP